MSSAILYKFRSGTTFEALPLPGSGSRVLEVKRAIVEQKRLDKGGALEFDLSLKDAMTNQVYADEGALLPRGTRLIVQRLPALKGQGLLARLANAAGGGAPSQSADAPGAPDGFYTAGSRGYDEEFVTRDAQQELEALQAATMDTTTTTLPGTGGGANTASSSRQYIPGGGGPPRPTTVNPRNTTTRPNADPELREQEKLLQPKKRATGIPRTFQAMVDAAEGNETKIQPNALGFQDLIQRAGGQSQQTLEDRLRYALQVTGNPIPDYLQCAICGNVVRDAMMLPWDEEGRTCCESCIRNALQKSGLTCPLTGMEGVSPDDLLPNHGLRKAATTFTEKVLGQLADIEATKVADGDDIGDEAEPEAETAEISQVDALEEGALVRQSAATVDTKKAVKEDPFGGDVFAIVTEEPEEETPEEAPMPTLVKEETKSEAPGTEKTAPAITATGKDDGDKAAAVKVESNAKEEVASSPAPAPVEKSRRRRGLPSGYTMGVGSDGPRGPPRDESRDRRTEQHGREDDRMRRDDFDRGREDHHRGSRDDPRGRDDFRGRDDHRDAPRRGPYDRDENRRRDGRYQQQDDRYRHEEDRRGADRRPDDHYQSRYEDNKRSRPDSAREEGPPSRRPRTGEFRGGGGGGGGRGRFEGRGGYPRRGRGRGRY